MNLIIKVGPNNYFQRYLSEGAFKKNDLLLCRRRDEMTEAFDQDKVLIIEDENEISIAAKLIMIVWKQKVKQIFYVSENPPALLARIALGILAFFSFAQLKIYIKDACEDYNVFSAFREVLGLGISPLISLLLVPKFFYKEALRNFILPRENKNRPFISTAKSGRLSGVIYWYSFAKRAEMNGLLGYAFNEYMGVPVSLYNFPLSLFLISKLRFRATYTIGFLLFAIGIFGIYAMETNLSIAIIVFITFLFMMSNIVWEHASLGVYEILAWGFGVLGLLFFSQGMAVIAGMFVGFSVLSHLGVATLLCLLQFVYAMVKGSFIDFVLTGIVAFFVAGYWFVPYFLQRKRLTRMQMINKEWDYKYRFDHIRLIQFLLYLVFAAFLYFFRRDTGVLALASLPLLIAYINAKIKWLYSPYTVRMFQAVVGIFCLSLAFNLYSLFFLLYFLYLPPNLLSWEDHSDKFYYRFFLHPRDELIKKTEEFFSCLAKWDRVGFELGSKKSGRNLVHEDLSTFFSYFLLDKDCEVFNTGMTQLVKFDLYEKTCSNFNANASFAELREAVSASGVSCLVAFSEPFKKILEENGFRKKNTARLKHIFKSNTVDIEASMYEVPFINEKSIPNAQIDLGKNCLTIKFPVEGDYRLKYSYDLGLICKQGRNNLILKDDGKGMILVKDAESGEASIYYSHNRLFRYVRDRNSG
jgi:hypothetical protein